MNTIGLLIIVVGFLLTGILLKVVRVPRNILLMADGEEDEDVKIAGGSFGRDPSANEEIAEQAAKEFLRQKEKGNIDKAGMLGEKYADALWQVGQELIMDEDDNAKILVQNTLTLYNYVINKVVAEHSPTPLLAQTALSVFNKRVTEVSSVLDGYISDTAGAMTLYMLNDRNDGEQAIGEIFASLCGDESNQELVDMGNRAYTEFYAKCKKLFEENANYVA